MLSPKFINAFGELRALVFKEGDFLGEVNAIVVPFDFDIDIAVSLMGDNQVSSHFLQYLHEYVNKVLLLL